MQYTFKFQSNLVDQAHLFDQIRDTQSVNRIVLKRDDVDVQYAP